ncbi:MAG: thiol peroxidase [Actinomycetota bacterium]|jgi:thiol peroxidase
MAAKKAKKSAKKVAARKPAPKKKSAKKPKKAVKKSSPAKKTSTVTLGGNPVKTNGQLPKVGAKAPAFSMTTGTLSEIGPKELRGKRVILNIFPSIDTPTCATSTRKFNEFVSTLPNTEVWCVSADLPFAQGRFCGAEGLSNVKTASSFRTNFGTAMGVTLTSGVLKGILARAVVVLDENGVVTHTELVPEIANEPNYEAALKALR